MKILKYILIFFTGLVCGIVLIIIIKNSTSFQPLVEVTIENQSQSRLKKVIVHADNLNNNYTIDNLTQNNSEKIYLYARGEIGYSIMVELENGDSLITSAYAESGYKDLYVVKKDSIIKKFNNY